jgi:hypothetical protein
MKTFQISFSMLVAAVLLTGCTLVSMGKNIQPMTPSDVVITENRSVTGFTGIDFSTFGKVTITQGTSESLTITGSDNIVPLVTTTITNGTLIIKTKDNIDILEVISDNILIINITVKDLNQLTNSGACQITMEQLNTDSIDITLSGAGDIDIAGETTTAKIDLSGAGSVAAAELKAKNADVTISGIGSAEIWVTDVLTGNISGVGNIRYFGDPSLNTEKTGLGNYESLGDK